jgi:hypothetical protein
MDLRFRIKHGAPGCLERVQPFLPETIREPELAFRVSENWGMIEPPKQVYSQDERGSKPDVGVYPHLGPRVNPVGKRDV